MKHATVLALVGIMALGAAAQEDEARASEAGKVRDRLAAMKITLDFKDAPLPEVIRYFQEYTGLNFHLDSSVDREGQEPARVTLKLKDVTVRTALKIVLNPRDLVCAYRDGVLVVQPKSRAAGLTVTRVYDIRDLLFRLEDFPGPKLELDPKKPGILFDVAIDEPKTVFPEDLLLDLIRTSTGSRTWDDSSIASLETTKTGLLVVTQSKTVHEELKRFLDLLRQYK